MTGKLWALYFWTLKGKLIQFRTCGKIFPTSKTKQNKNPPSMWPLKFNSWHHLWFPEYHQGLLLSTGSGRNLKQLGMSLIPCPNTIYHIFLLKTFISIIYITSLKPINLITFDRFLYYSHKLSPENFRIHFNPTSLRIKTFYLSENKRRLSQTTLDQGSRI